MKSRTALPFALFAISMSCLAQEANPFVQKKNEAKAPEAPPGPAFVGILEHILVPPDLIDEWIRQHGMPADASALRAEVQKWVEEGKAVLDCSAVATGVKERWSQNERILEQLYPTEYMSNGPGVWPLPTAFEARNLGHSARFATEEADGRTRFSIDADYYEMQGSTAWNHLVNQTRHPDDVFLPVIRTYRLTQKGPTSRTQDVDPFAAPEGPFMQRDDRPTFESGRISLMGRFDPLPFERKSGLPARLVFARGDVENQSEKSAFLPEDYGVSIAAIRVSHLEFSSWLQQQAPLSVPRGAWQFTESLRKIGKAEVVDAANARAKASKACAIENLSEYIYPTEWEPMNRITLLEKWQESKSERVDGKQVDGIATRASMKIEAIPGLAGASLATSFETRNTGMTYEIRVLPDEHGVVVDHIIERVQQVGETVCRRIEDQGNWVPDITMPLFSTGRSSTTNRLQPGKWTLISSGVEYAENGKVDREHCLLMFVKVE
jgi:hypothetical protein